MDQRRKGLLFLLLMLLCFSSIKLLSQKYMDGLICYYKVYLSLVHDSVGLRDVQWWVKTEQFQVQIRNLHKFLQGYLESRTGFMTLFCCFGFVSDVKAVNFRNAYREMQQRKIVS